MSGSPTTDFVAGPEQAGRDQRAPRVRVGVLIGKELAGVRVQQILAASSMSDVYLGVDTRSGEKRIIKACRDEFDREGNGRSRFRREIALHSKISSQHIPRIRAAGRLGGTRFLIMDHVRGTDLITVLKRHISDDEPMGISVIVRLAIDIVAGLEAIARCGIVHRDLKPANILIDDTGRAKIIDFGIATTIREEHFTEEHHVLGTSGYMSPEQWAGNDVDQRSDIYALGIVLLEMLTGLLPPQRADLGCAMQPDFLYQPDLLSSLRPDAPPALARIVAQCLRRDRRLRYHQFDTIQRDLRQVLAGLEEECLSARPAQQSHIVAHRVPEIVIVVLLVCVMLAYALL